MRTRVGAIAATFLMIPASAWACPVCGLASPGDSEWAYAAMSVMLSALPLGMIGGTVFWLYRRSVTADIEPVAPNQGGTAEEHIDVPQHQDAVQFRTPGDR